MAEQSEDEKIGYRDMLFFASFASKATCGFAFLSCGLTFDEIWHRIRPSRKTYGALYGLLVKVKEEVRD